MPKDLFLEWLALKGLHLTVKKNECDMPESCASYQAACMGPDALSSPLYPETTKP